MQKEKEEEEETVGYGPVSAQTEPARHARDVLF